MTALIVFGAQYLYLVILAVAVIFFFTVDAHARRHLFWLAAIVFPVSFIISRLLRLIISNPRPFMVEGVTPLIAHAADNGFPSDHALLSMAVAAVVFTKHRALGLLLAALAVVVGVARVAAKVHHPVDILGSAAIAIVITFTAEWFLKKSACHSK